MKRYIIFAIVFIVFLASAFEDRTKMHAPIRQEVAFSEEDALKKTISELGLPNLGLNSAFERNVKFCGTESFAVAFENKVQKVDLGRYLVMISDRWKSNADQQEKLKRIRFYYVSQDDFQLQYQDGSIAAAIGECSGDEYGLKSFQPVSSGVFIPQQDINQIQGHDAEKEATLSFIQAWAAKDHEGLIKWTEPSLAMNTQIEQILDNRYSYAFTGMQGPLLLSDEGVYCSGVQYTVSDSIEKEDRQMTSAVCLKSNVQGKWNVYMID